MTIPQQNSLLVAAIAAGLLSLPMPWFKTTLLSFSIQIGPGQTPAQRPHFNPPLVTGLTGNVEFLLTTPLWFVVALSIAACIMQFMVRSSVFEIPRWVIWLTPLLGIGGAILPLWPTRSYERVTPELGWWLGMFCACTPLACLLWTRSAGAVRSVPTNPAAPSIQLPAEL